MFGNFLNWLFSRLASGEWAFWWIHFQQIDQESQGRCMNRGQCKWELSTCFLTGPVLDTHMHSSLVLSAACGLKPQGSFSPPRSQYLSTLVDCIVQEAEKNETWAYQKKSSMARISYMWQWIWTFLPTLEHGWLGKKKKKNSREGVSKTKVAVREDKKASLLVWLHAYSHTTWSKVHFNQGRGIWALRLATLPGVGKERAWTSEGKLGYFWLCSIVLTHPYSRLNCKDLRKNDT